MKRKTRKPRIESFDFPRGRPLAGRFTVDSLIGKGWEGEVYRVIEARTGIVRAAKFFYPHRNENDVALKRYARKLDKLSDCRVLVNYHHSDAIRYRNHQVSFLLSGLVTGEPLEDFVKRQPGGRLQVFTALHLIRALALGVEEIHDHGEYHGDLHDRNVLVKRRGIRFEVYAIDLYTRGRSSRAKRQDDILELVHLLYTITGGARHYARQPPELKEICRGLKRSLILQSFPTIGDLIAHLDHFEWNP